VVKQGAAGGLKKTIIAPGLPRAQCGQPAQAGTIGVGSYTIPASSAKIFYRLIQQ